jgi:hypothetical protein
MGHPWQLGQVAHCLALVDVVACCLEHGHEPGEATFEPAFTDS